MEKYEESERYFEQAAQLSMATGSARIKHNSVSNLSQLLSTLGKMEESYQLAQTCLELPNPQNLKDLNAACHEAFAEAYLKDGKYEQAIESAKTLDRLRLAVENNNLEVDSESLGATISFGAVNELSAQSIKQEWDQWFFAADQALYDAKQSGRNQYQIHSTS